MPVSTPTGEQGTKHDRQGHKVVHVRRALLPWLFAFGAALSACTDKDSTNKQVLSGTITSQSPTTGAVRSVPIHLLAAFKSSERKDEARLLDQILNATISPGGKVTPRFTADRDSKGIRPYEVTVDEVMGDGPYQVKSTIQECVKDTTNCGPIVELTWKFVIDTTPPEFTDIAVSTETGMFQGSGKMVDKTTNVKDISGMTCGTEKKPIPLRIKEDGTFNFSLPASVGENCADITATDQVGNASTKKLDSKYQFDVGFTVKPAVKENEVTISGDLPKSANPNTLKASGKQSQWRYFGIEGDVKCGQSAIDGTHYKIQCRLPSSTGGPAQIHVTFEDINGKKFDVYYQDKSNLFLNIPDPTKLDYFAWWGMIAAQVLASVLVTSSGIGIGVCTHAQFNERNRKRRGEKYSLSKLSDRSTLIGEFSRDSHKLFGMTPIEKAVYDQIESAHRSAKAGMLTVALQNILDVDVSRVKSLAYLKQTALGELVTEVIDRLEHIERNPSIETLKNDETAFLLKMVNNILNTDIDCRRFIGKDQVARARRYIRTLQVAKDSYSLSLSDLENNYAYLWIEDTKRAHERLRATAKGLFRIGNYTAAGVIIGHAKGELKEELTREYNNGVTHMLNYLVERGDYKAALSGYDILHKLSPELLPSQNTKIDDLLSHVYSDFLTLITRGDRSVLSDERLIDLLAAIRHSLGLPWLQKEGIVTSNFKEAVADQAHELYLVSLAEANSIELVMGEFAVAQQNPDSLLRTIDIFARWKDLRTLAHVADKTTDVSAQSTIRSKVSTAEDAITEQLITALAKRDQLSAQAVVNPYKLTKTYEAKVDQIVRTDVELQRAAEKVRKIYKHYGQDAEKGKKSQVATIMKGEDLEFWRHAYRLPPEKAGVFLLAMVTSLKIPRSLFIGVNTFGFRNNHYEWSPIDTKQVTKNRALLNRAFHPDTRIKAEGVTMTPGEAAFDYFCTRLFPRIFDLEEKGTGKINLDLIRRFDELIVNESIYCIIMSLLTAMSLDVSAFGSDTDVVKYGEKSIERGVSVMYIIRSILARNML